MALQFYLPFTSLNRGPALAGEEWDIELWNSEFSGTADEANGDPQGCVIEWEGGQDPIAGILTSSATYSILIRDESEMGLIDALAGAPRGQFKMVVRRAGSEMVYWAGYVHTDQVSWPDAYFPFLLEIYATDGLADLKDIDYIESEGTPYEGEATIIEHLVNIVGKIGLTDVGTWPTNRFRSTANWYSEDMVTTNGPLAQAEVLHDRFIGKDREGNAEYWNCYAVVDALMGVMNCQLLHEGGMYHVRQLENYHNNTNKAHYYDATGALTATTSAENLDIEVDYASDAGMVKTAGGRYTFLPPVHEVCVDFHHRTNHNRALGEFWENDFPATDNTWHILPAPVLVDEDDTTYIKAHVVIRHRSQIGVVTGTAIWPPHRLVFRLQLRIYANVPGQYYYLYRTVQGTSDFFDVQADQMAWEFGASVPADQMLIHSAQVVQADNLVEKSMAISFTTPYIPAFLSGNNLEMRLELVDVIKTDGNTIVFDSSPYNGFVGFETDEVFMAVEGEGHAGNPDNETLRTCSEVTENTEKRYIDTWLGDGPAPFSLSAIRVGGVAAQLWQIGAAGSAMTIAKLLGQQLLRFRKRPQRVYQGAFIHPALRPYSRFVDDDLGYMATSIAVDCFNNIWSGEFLLMDGTVSGISSGEPHVPVSPTHLPTGFPGGAPNLPQLPGTTFPDPRIPPFDGMAGGTLPGYVSTSEQSPATLTDGVVAADFNNTALSDDHELPITAVDYAFAKKGDAVSIVNAITGHRETFTLRESYAPGATVLKLKTSETMSKDFPFGSFVKLSQTNAPRTAKGSFYERGVTGTGSGAKFWLVDDAELTLPSPADFDAKTLRERVRIVMGGTTLIYDPNPYDDCFGLKPSTNEVEVYLGIPAGTTMYVEVS